MLQKIQENLVKNKTSGFGVSMLLNLLICIVQPCPCVVGSDFNIFIHIII